MYVGKSYNTTFSVIIYLTIVQLICTAQCTIHVCFIAIDYCDVCHIPILYLIR